MRFHSIPEHIRADPWLASSFQHDPALHPVDERYGLIPNGDADLTLGGAAVLGGCECPWGRHLDLDVGGDTDDGLLWSTLTLGPTSTVKNIHRHDGGAGASKRAILERYKVRPLPRMA